MIENLKFKISNNSKIDIKKLIEREKENLIEEKEYKMKQMKRILLILSLSIIGLFLLCILDFLKDTSINCIDMVCISMLVCNIYNFISEHFEIKLSIYTLNKKIDCLKEMEEDMKDKFEEINRQIEEELL